MAQLNDEINALIDAVKNGAYSDRIERMAAIEALLERHGRPPEPAQLDRLADLCLREELYDSTPMKAKMNEYPFLSESQLMRRNQPMQPLSAGKLQATDGKCYRTPRRRKRFRKENAFMDREVKARNRGRKKKYNDFVRGKIDGWLRVVINNDDE